MEGTTRMKWMAWSILIWALLGPFGPAFADQSPPSKSRAESALQNIVTLVRPGQRGFATIWDGNKYVQCGRQDDGGLRCEAAGTLMQPSLKHVLSPERIAKIDALGWKLDPSFGNYVQSFPKDVPLAEVADRLLQVLADGYAADLAQLRVETAWVANEACPPRNGPSQNLAGMVNNAPAMAATAVHACAFTPKSAGGPNLPASSAAELIQLYGDRVTGELQRLRVNIDRRVFVAFEAGIGYVQCRPQTSPAAIYCEAQSADSWPALTSVLTSARVEQLHALGFGDPGRGPNYWKVYQLDRTDVSISHELLSLLYDVYGYTGVPELKIVTEEGHGR